MNCNDCLHSDVCEKAKHIENYRLSECNDFKDKKNFVELKHGKWKLHSSGNGTCSLCGITQKNVWDYDNWQNYCGHCGAIMDEGE